MVANADADLIPLVTRNQNFSDIMDHTLPTDIVAMSALVRPDDVKYQSVDDLKTARIGTFTDPRFLLEHAELQTAEITRITDHDALIFALENNEIDAIVGATEKLARTGISERFRAIEAPDFALTRTIGLRSGLGFVRERLNAVIPVYHLSNDYIALRNKYFGPEVYWSAKRLSFVLGTISAAFLLLLGSFLWQRNHQRKLIFVQQEQDFERQRAHSTTLGKLVAELELANREQAEFTYSISHDLKSPTNTIKMLISELEDEQNISADVKSVLSDMKVTNRRMAQLIEDVLHYSRIVEGSAQFEPVNCNALVDDIIVDLASDIASAKAKVTRHPLPDFHGHPMQLRILFQNLIANAVKFRAPDRPPVIKIMGKSMPGCVMISVCDNGIGIAEEHRERVFGMFNRLHIQTEYEGTGLGLSMCRRVVSNHSGEIVAKPRPGGGTIFEITFEEAPDAKAD